MIKYTLSLNTTQNDPDISSLPLYDLKQELSASLNTQSQAPDDPFHAQDSSCAPRDSLYNSPSISQEFQMLPTRIFTVPFLPQTVSQDFAFTPQLHTENALSGILALRGSCSTSSTDSICQTGFGLCI